MSWVQVTIAAGYLLVLLAVLALLHGASLVYRDLHQRRLEEEEQQKTAANSKSASHVA